MRNEELMFLDKHFATNLNPDVPALFEQVSLEDFGRLFLDIPSTCPGIKSWLPPMPPMKCNCNGLARPETYYWINL
jgi:hypothetical protein